MGGPPRVGEFDQAIEFLGAFEELRYPDSVIVKGAAILFQWVQPVPPRISGPAAYDTPRYVLVVNDIDRLVARIFQVSKRNPQFFTALMNEHARTAISHMNPVAEFLFSGKP